MEYRLLFNALRNAGKIRAVIKETERMLSAEYGVKLRLEVKELDTEVLIDAVARMVGGELGVTMNVMLHDGRSQEAVEARQIAMALALEYIPGLTLKEVARYFRLHHSTVIHAMNRVKELLGVGDEVMRGKFGRCQKCLLENWNL